MIKWVKSTAWPLIERTFKAWDDDNCYRMAAALAYYAVFSIFPLILLLVSILGFWLRFRGVTLGEGINLVEQLLDRFGTSIPSNVKISLAQILEGIKLDAGFSGPIALVTTLIAATGIFVQLDQSFDTIWNIVPAQGNFLTTIKHTVLERGKAFVMVLSIGGLLVASLLVSTLLSGIAKIAQLDGFVTYTENLPGVAFGWQIITLLVAFLLNVAVFGILFYAMPKPRMRWRDILPAALITGVLWEIGKQVLSRFLANNQYTASATIGAFIALLAWIYYASLIIFFGAEFAQVYTRWNEERRRAANPTIIPLPAAPDFPTVRLPDPKATASEKAAYAASGAVLGVASALLLTVGGVVLGIIKLIGGKKS